MCYDVIPVFWAAGETKHISYIWLDAIPIELTGVHTNGVMVFHSWERIHVQKTGTVSADYVTLTDSLDAERLKQRLMEFVLT